MDFYNSDTVQSIDKDNPDIKEEIHYIKDMFLTGFNYFLKFLGSFCVESNLLIIFKWIVSSSLKVFDKFDWLQHDYLARREFVGDFRVLCK